jgi:hypothetical protein
MDITTALKVATMSDVDLWKMCPNATVAEYQTPDSLRAEALEVVAVEVAEAERELPKKVRGK